MTMLRRMPLENTAAKIHMTNRCILEQLSECSYSSMFSVDNISGTIYIMFRALNQSTLKFSAMPFEFAPSV